MGELKIQFSVLWTSLYPLCRNNNLIKICWNAPFWYTISLNIISHINLWNFLLGSIPVITHLNFVAAGQSRYFQTKKHKTLKKIFSHTLPLLDSPYKILFRILIWLYLSTLGKSPTPLHNEMFKSGVSSTVMQPQATYVSYALSM